MGKVQEYDIRKLGQQAVDVVDDIRDILNFGKVAHPIVSAVPAWTADNGEMAFYDGGTSSTLPGKRIYVRLSSSWEVFATAGNGVPAPPEGAIQFNSANFFGGDANFRYVKTVSSLIMTDVVNAVTSLIVGTAGNLSILGGSHGALSQGVIAMGFGSTSNQARNNTVQLFAYGAGGADPTKLYVIPESGGPHLFGDVVVLSDATVTIRDLDSSAIMYITGKSSNSAPSQISFSDSAAGEPIRFSIYYANDIAGANPRVGPALVLNVANSASPFKGFVLVDGGQQSNLTVEQPEFVIGEQNLAGLQGAEYSWSGNTHLTHQRTVWLIGAQLKNGSGGIVNSISNAATLYIQNAPTVASGSINILNNYALWVDEGAVRFDGDIIIGGATTQAKPEGVFFSTTAIGVSSNNTSDTTLIRGVIGTTSLVANTLSEGRTIRLQAAGYYNSPATPGTMVMTVKLSGATILSTSSQTVTANASTFGWTLQALLTCQTTGGAGTLFAQGYFDNQASAIALNRWQMVGSSAVTFNTTGGAAVEVTCQWGTANASSQLFCTNAVGELLN